MKRKIILISCIIILRLAYADILQNPDFELPPANLPKNLNSTFVTLNENNTIPGWTFQGMVQYVTAGPEMQLQRNGHAILLGEDGKINQTFIADANQRNYFLTFALALGGEHCAANVSLIVSAPDSEYHFSLRQNYSKAKWEIYGTQLGSWGNREPINLVLQSQAIDMDPNSTCWPIVDTLSLTAINPLPQDNLLSNGDFEWGPPFPDNSSEGVLLDPEPSLAESSLQPWTVMGTIRYIDSKHYYVPKGDAAVELISGVGAGIQTETTLKQDSSYTLEFILGDANDSCTGDFIVGVGTGSSAENITLGSSGTGSARQYSITFKGGPNLTPITFQSYKTSQREDGVFCGPMVDDVVLRASGALRHHPWSTFPVAVFLVKILLASL